MEIAFVTLRLGGYLALVFWFPARRHGGRGGPATDLLMGGLNCQIEHHLFPSMPRPNLRHVQPTVRAFCADRGISYTEISATRPYAIVVRYLNRVGLAARDPFLCPLAAEYRSGR